MYKATAPVVPLDKRSDHFETRKKVYANAWIEGALQSGGSRPDCGRSTEDSTSIPMVRCFGMLT